MYPTIGYKYNKVTTIDTSVDALSNPNFKKERFILKGSMKES